LGVCTGIFSAAELEAAHSGAVILPDLSDLEAVLAILSGVAACN
jgi:hypothetical protein